MLFLLRWWWWRWRTDRTPTSFNSLYTRYIFYLKTYRANAVYLYTCKFIYIYARFVCVRLLRLAYKCSFVHIHIHFAITAHFSSGASFSLALSLFTIQRYYRYMTSFLQFLMNAEKKHFWWRNFATTKMYEWCLGAVANFKFNSLRSLFFYFF